MDMGANLRLAKLFSEFAQRHPKVAPFLSGVRSSGLQERMEVAVAIRYPDGTEYKTGIRLTAEDVAMLQDLKNIKG